MFVQDSKRSNIFEGSVVVNAKPVHQVYIYDCGISAGKYRYNIDFYNLKSNKNIKYIRARTYWVNRLFRLLNSVGGGLYTPRKIR